MKNPEVKYLSENSAKNDRFHLNSSYHQILLTEKRNEVQVVDRRYAARKGE